MTRSPCTVSAACDRNTREPLVINENIDEEAEYGIQQSGPDGRDAEIGRLRADGRGRPGQRDRSACRTWIASTPSANADVRLLQTLASSMSVALENARLFDETQRLLKETEQRAAELAIINSVQQGAGLQAGHAGHLRPGRRQDPRHLQGPRWSHCDSTIPGVSRSVAPVLPGSRGPAVRSSPINLGDGITSPCHPERVSESLSARWCGSVGVGSASTMAGRNVPVGPRRADHRWADDRAGR